MGQRLTYWIFIGAFGLATFFLLHPSIDFNAGAPIEDSRTTIEGKTAELAGWLEFSTDSLNLLTTRTQHLGYYNVLKDSLQDLFSVEKLNKRGVNLTGWKVVIGTHLKEQDFFVNGADEIFNKIGILELHYDDQGKIRRMQVHPAHRNPTFVAGDSLFSIAGYIVNDIFNYKLSNYRLNYVDIKDSLLSSAEKSLPQQTYQLSNSNVGNNTVFNWKKSNPGYKGAEELTLEIKPVIKENSNRPGERIRYGAAIEKFSAQDNNEPEKLEGASFFSNIRFIISFLSLGLLICIVFVTGIKHINKGHVEWKRAIFILVSIGLGFFGWRAIYLINTLDPFFNDTSTSVFLLNQLLMGAACGLYAALAYIGWEAIARSENQEQIHLVDAYWRKRFFFRETGDSLLRGYAFGGVLLGLFALLIYFLKVVYYQQDSQFGFTEPSLQPKLLTINMSAWTNAWMVALGHVGVIGGILKQKLQKSWLYYLGGTFVLGFLFAGSACLIGINGPIWYDLGVFTLLAPVILFVFSNSGLLTFSTGWWLFTVIVLIMPYWGSSSLDVAYVAWVEGFVILAPAIYGFIAFRYGDSVSEMGGYIPEYQERMANYLRVEKEIEIARESQFKLMPLQPPAIDGIDVYGFFMPSFEVGGDYFDYVASSNGTAEPEALMMTIVDVSGKAMKAAMHAVFTSGLLLSRLHKDNPEDILSEIAPTIYSRTDPQTFITCIIAKYHLANRNLSIANAGHCLPILKRDGKACFIKTPVPKYPLGLKKEVTYQALEIKLQPGDFILLYSDGLPEAVDPEGNRFEYDSLVKLVESLDTGTKSSNEIALDIKRRVQKFSDYQLADDTTIICLKI